MSKKLAFIIFFITFSSSGYSYFQSLLPYKLAQSNSEDKKIEYGVYGDASGLKYSKIFEKLGYTVNLKSFQGLHRILSEIQAQSKLKRIIYFGNLSEALEKKLDPSDTSSFLHNYHDLFHSYKSKLHRYLPFLANFFFKTYKSRIHLADHLSIQPYKVSKSLYPKYREAMLKVYSLELKQLISLAKDKNIELVFITSVIDYKKLKAQSCVKTNPKDYKFLNQMKKFSSLGDFDKAYQFSKNLSLKDKFNTNILFQHALISEYLGRKDEALNTFKAISNFNCDYIYPDNNYNNVLRKTAQIYNIKILDLEKTIEQSYLLGNIKSFSKIITSKNSKIVLWNFLKSLN